MDNTIQQLQELISTHKPQDEQICCRTFDRSHETNPVPADRCFKGIGAFCKVEIGYAVRTEQMIYGEKQVKLLAIKGPRPRVSFANWLYGKIDDIIDNTTDNYINSRFAHTEDQVNDFRNSVAIQINKFLIEQAKNTK